MIFEIPKSLRPHSRPIEAIPQEWSRKWSTQNSDVEDNMGALCLHSKRSEVPEHKDIVDTRHQASGRDIEVNFNVALESTHGLGEEEESNNRQIQIDLNRGSQGIGVDRDDHLWWMVWMIVSNA